MSESRTKNAERNIAFGLINRVATLILPFISRTIILYLLGDAYVGVGTLFTSVLSFLSLAELGVGSAVVYSMYKPIAEKDYELVGALLGYYRRLYRWIGTAILAVGLAILPLIPVLTHKEAPEGVDIYILYCIYLVNSVISYFFAGYRQSLLSAHQRTDVISGIATVIAFFVRIVEIVVLILTRNFYFYAFVPVAGTLLTNAIIAAATRRMYPAITCRGVVPNEIRKDINKKITGLFGTKLYSTVIHQADAVVISACFGLAMAAIYGNYHVIFNAVSGFVTILFTSVTAGIGNKLVTDPLNSNFLLFRRLRFANEWIVCWCCVCFACLYEPVMELWAGKERCLGSGFAVLMSAYFFLSQIQRTMFVFKDAAGVWEQDKKRPYASMLVNLVGNLLLVRVAGVYGVLCATLLAYCVSLPWMNATLFRYVFHRDSIENLISILKCFLVTAAIGGITYVGCLWCRSGVIGVAERFVICCIVPNAFLCICMHQKEEFRFWKSFLQRMIGCKAA